MFQLQPLDILKNEIALLFQRVKPLVRILVYNWDV